MARLLIVLLAVFSITGNSRAEDFFQRTDRDAIYAGGQKTIRLLDLGSSTHRLSATPVGHNSHHRHWHFVGCVNSHHACEHHVADHGYHHHRVRYDHHRCHHEPHLACFGRN